MAYETLFANQVEAFLQHENVTVFDHRDPRSYAQQHLPDAVPVSDANVGEVIKSKAFDKPILIYCYHGHSSRELCKFFT